MANTWGNQQDGISRVFWRNFVIPNVHRIKKTCEWCHEMVGLEIHRTSYETVTIHNLVLLCRPCHKREHHRLKKYGIKLPGER